MKFEIYREKPNDEFVRDGGNVSGDWRWRLKSENGRIVAEGGEGYKRSHHMVASVRKYVALSLESSAALGAALKAAGLTITGHKAK